MSLVLDLIIVLLVSLFVFLSAKKGFVYTLIEVVGFVAAIIIAFTFSTPVANGIYDKAIQPAVVSTIESVVDDGAQTIDSTVDAVVNKLPAFLQNGKLFNFSNDGVLETLNGQDNLDSTQIVTTVSQNYIKPPIVKLISTFVVVLLVVVLFVVVKMLAKVINKLFSFSLVGKINKTLGGILGAVKGLAIAMVFCFIIGLILSITNEGFLIFTHDNINSTFIFKTLMGLSPLI